MFKLKKCKVYFNSSTPKTERYGPNKVNRFTGYPVNEEMFYLTVHHVTVTKGPTTIRLKQVLINYLYTEFTNTLM